MKLQHTFQPSDEPRFQRIVELVTMRRPFAYMFILCGVVFAAVGIGIIRGEPVPGVLFIGIGLAAVFKTIRILSRASQLRMAFSNAIKAAPLCTWIFDDAGICLAPDRTLSWSQFKQATFCSDGAILTGKEFVWIPSEAFRNTEETQALRKQLVQAGIRCATK